MPDELISGATDTQYVPTDPADLGRFVYCRVRGDNAFGFSTANSNTIGPIAAASAGFAFIASAQASGQLGPITTSVIDTTGADLLIVGVSQYEAPGSVTITDNKSNTWTGLTIPAGGTTEGRIWYCKPTTVGSGHTVSANVAGGFYGGITFAAFSGSHVTPFDVQAGNGNNAGTAASAGSLTPSVNGCLVISNVSNHVTAAGMPDLTIASGGSGFILLPMVVSTPTSFPQRMAYLVQSTLAAVNPVWTVQEASWTAVSASFKSASSG